MPKLAVKGNAKYGVAILIAGITLLVLLLNPSPALGVGATLTTSDTAVKLGEQVEMSGTVTLTAGEFSNITSVKADVTGAVTESVDLPVPAIDGESISDSDLSSQLTAGGTLTVSMTTTGISVNGYGYGYGYLGQTVGGGSIAYTLQYTPPSVTGEYTVTLNVYVDKILYTRDDGDVVYTDLAASASATFNVLDTPVVTALSTLYPIGGTEAIEGDLVILQIDTDTDPSFISSATVAADVINSSSLGFIKASDFHAALLGKWGVSSSADFLLPFVVATGTQLGENEVTVTVTDTAGNTPGTGTVTFNVPFQRSKFTVYLNPGLNYISTPLQPSQTVGVTGSGSTNAFAITTDILTQDISSFANTGYSTLEDVIEAIFAFPGGGSDIDFEANIPGPAFDNLSTIAIGRGYIISTDSAAFKTHTPALAGFIDPVSQPIPLVFTGEVLHPAQVPPTFDVTADWNLVGLHSETDSTVDRFLAGALVTDRTWVSLFEFINSVGVKTSSGAVQGTPGLNLVLGQFRGLFGGRTGTLEGDPVRAGAAEWLFMAEADQLTPVLERD